MAKLYLLFVVLLSASARAQDNQKFTAYGEDIGLPQSSIYDISQDKDGFIWIGTAGGLCRFDGYEMKVYQQSSTDPKAISSYKEFRFYKDSAQRLWIVSFNGISLYNSLTDNFTNTLVYSPRNVVMAENHFFGEDKTHIWVGLCNYGIVKVDKQTARASHTPLTTTTLRPSTNVAYKGFLDKGKIWIVDNNESPIPVCYTYDIAKQEKKLLPLPVINIVNFNDTMAIGINQQGLLLINKNTLAYTTIALTEKGKSHDGLNIYPMGGNEVVVSSATHGLFYVDIKQRKVSKQVSYTDPLNKKAGLLARCVFRDRSGNTWVGTRGEGVFKQAYPYKKFRALHTAGNNNVFGLTADDKHVYAGFTSGGLTRFSHTDTMTNNTQIAGTIRNAQNNVLAINALDNERLLLLANNATHNGPVIPCIYVKATGRVQPVNTELTQFFAQHWGLGNMRYFMVNDTYGNTLTGIGEYLVSISACGERKLCAKELARFPNEVLTTAMNDRKGNTWVGTFTGLFKQRGQRWERVALPFRKEVKSIGQDADGNLWLGSNDDLLVIDENGKPLRRYTEDSGLVNAHVYAILRDEQGNMWFSHNKGLSVFRWREKKFRHYNKEDGLPSLEYNVNSRFKAKNGELFFGGINGVTAFYNREIQQNPHAPAVKITGIRIFDEPYRSPIAYWNIRKLELPYTENNISFEFSMPEFSNIARNRYMFMMKDVDQKWTDAGDRRFARYAGLSPGHYTFNVRGVNSDGVMSNEITTLEIHIIPPFWKRAWFMALVALAVIALFIGAGIFIQKIRQRKAMRAMEIQQRIQSERERISRDLHDNVGTQLSLINKNIEGVINPLSHTTEEERLRNLGNISQTSREVIFTLRETIWALSREQISVEELSDKLKSFTQKLFELNNGCRLLFSEKLEDDLVLSPSEAIHLFRICQEAIANSLKYSNASLMRIEITAQGGKYSIAIEDDGVGFDQDQEKEGLHYGLDNMRYRAADIDCELRIDSAPGKGTTITIHKK